MSLAEDLIAALDEWVGTPYVKIGCACGPRGGTNCGHYVMKCLIDLLPKGEELLSHTLLIGHNQVVVDKADVITPTFDLFADEVPLEEMKRGDIVIFRFFNVPMQPNIYLGNDQFIYCTRPSGVVKGPLPPNLRKRIMRVYRLRET